MRFSTTTQAVLFGLLAAQPAFAEQADIDSVDVARRYVVSLPLDALTVYILMVMCREAQQMLHVTT